MRPNLSGPTRHSWLLPAVVAFVMGCQKSGNEPVTLPPPKVDVAEVLDRKVPLFNEFIGQTEAIATVEVRARVEGIVEKIAFSEGSEVHEGDLLFQLEKEPSQQRLRKARGRLAETEAARAKATTDVNRLKPLAEQRAIPRQDYENALAALDQTTASVEAATADVRSAELDLGYCDIHAPISGLIGSKQADIGSLVGKGSPSVLATISPLNPIRVSATISEVEYLRVRRGGGPEEIRQRPVTLILPDDSVHTSIGRMVFAERTVDPTTGTLKVRAEFPNPDGLLRPGQFARIRIPLPDREHAILVPQRAVQEIQGQNNVWVVDSSNKVAFRRVQAGDRVGNLWVIENGLKAGERIVVEGVGKVRPDVTVDPTPVTIGDEALKGAATSGTTPKR